MDLFRVDTNADPPKSVTLAFVGHLNRCHLPEVNQAITHALTQYPRVIIDLRALHLLDRDSVFFLRACRDRGIPLVNTPPYILRWLNQCHIN